MSHRTPRSLQSHEGMRGCSPAWVICRSFGEHSQRSRCVCTSIFRFSCLMLRRLLALRSVLSDYYRLSSGWHEFSLFRRTWWLDGRTCLLGTYIWWLRLLSLAGSKSLCVLHWVNPFFCFPSLLSRHRSLTNLPTSPQWQHTHGRVSQLTLGLLIPSSRRLFMQPRRLSLSTSFVCSIDRYIDYWTNKMPGRCPLCIS